MKIVNGIDYIPQVKQLIEQYAERLNRNLDFQKLDEELENPAKKYTAPNGELAVVVDDKNRVVGMVAYRRLSSERCEMKRLYVTPEGRGHGLGEALVQHIICLAKKAGYTEMVLDTIKPLATAIHLYQKHGFTECEPYYDNPMNDVVYMKLDLTKSNF